MSRNRQSRIRLLDRRADHERLLRAVRAEHRNADQRERDRARKRPRRVDRVDARDVTAKSLDRPAAIVSGKLAPHRMVAGSNAKAHRSAS